MPETKLLKLGYTDDWALSYQSKDWEESERVLSRDTTELKRYFEQQYLKINITKTVLSVFHLNKKQAQNPLTITPIDRELVYLGVILEMSGRYPSRCRVLAMVKL